VVEVGQAAELLLGKVGDEVPDLPDQWPGNPGHGPPTVRGQTNQFAELVNLYIGADPGQVSLDQLKDALSALFDHGRHDGQTPPLATLAASLHGRDTGNPLVLDVLQLLEDAFADDGP
jgi:hypothetical protein